MSGTDRSITEQMGGTGQMGGTADPAAGVTAGEIDRIVAGIYHDPHSVLGAHA